MNVLVACEESQAVTKELRRLGHRAFSCDLQECSGGHLEWHIQSDILPLLNGNCTFQTADTHTHTEWAVGHDHCIPAVHRSRGKWGKMVPGKAKGRQTAKGHRFLYADGSC